MKNIFILMVSLFLCCCDREGPESSDEGKIIGTWENGFESSINLDGSFIDSVRPCRNIPFVIFRSDSSLFYQLRKSGGPQLCLPDTTFAANGSWERLRNEKYRFFLKNNTLGEPDTIIEPVRIYFTSEADIMKIQFEPVVDNGIDKPFYFETTFFRKNE